MMKLLKPFAALLALGVLASCDSPEAFEFHLAVQRMSNDMVTAFHLLSPLNQIGAAIAPRGDRDPNAVVLDAFVDGDTGNVIGASDEIGEIVSARLASEGLTVVKLTPATLQSAHYVVTGATKYEVFDASGKRLYRIYGSIYDTQSGQKVGSGAAWIANREIDARPTAFYKNSPMYLKDSTFHAKVAAAEGMAGPDAGPTYVRSLGAVALTREGESHLEARQYDQAVAAFQASQREPEGGDMMANRAGLFEAFTMERQMTKAEQVLYDLFATGMRENSSSVKFVFQVDSTEFIADSYFRSQYEILLKVIARYMAGSHECMIVSGHTSTTGAPEHNRALSQQRAEHIRALLTGLSASLAPRMSAAGRGADQCEKCQPVDNDETEFERRVDFQSQPCGQA